MSIEVYAFEDADGAEDTYTTLDPRDAEERAARYHLKVIARLYKYADSEVVWDYTGREEGESEEG